MKELTSRTGWHCALAWSGLTSQARSSGPLEKVALSPLAFAASSDTCQQSLAIRKTYCTVEQSRVPRRILSFGQLPSVCLEITWAFFSSELLLVPSSRMKAPDHSLWDLVLLKRSYSLLGSCAATSRCDLEPSPAASTVSSLLKGGLRAFGGCEMLSPRGRAGCWLSDFSSEEGKPIFPEAALWDAFHLLQWSCSVQRVVTFVLS